MLKKSPLHHIHRALGARFISHAGWDVPVNFGSVKAEHHAVRQECGMFDLPWLVHVDIQGSNAQEFLRRLLANDIDRLSQTGTSCYGLLLNEKGGILDDLIVHRLGNEHYRLVMDAERSDQDLAWIKAYMQSCSLKVSLSLPSTETEPLTTIALQGPLAQSNLWKVLPEVKAATINLSRYAQAQIGPILVATTGCTGEEGFEITLPAHQAEGLWRALMDIGVKPCGFCARDSLRTEAGFRLQGRDMDEHLSPFDVGLDWLVETTSGRNFIGREALLTRTPQWQLLGLKLMGSKGLLRDQQRILTPQGEGKITSATYSPTLEAYIALALLPLGVAVGDIVQASLRGHPLPVQVTKPHFVRYGKILVEGAPQILKAEELSA